MLVGVGWWVDGFWRVSKCGCPLESCRAVCVGVVDPVSPSGRSGVD